MLTTSPIMRSVALVLLLGCSEPRRPDVVLIVVDTLRSDAVGVYGSTRPTTPAIDAFAESATRFDRAYATAPWTQPSIASILTGLTPSEHGLVRFGSLPADVEPISVPLRAAGYKTAAVVSHILLARKFAFDRGFDDFAIATAYPIHTAVSSEAVSNRAIESIERLDQDDAPWFLFVHYFDPHYQFRRHPEIGFAPDRAGRLDGSESIEDLRAIMSDSSAEELAFVRALYDEEVRHTDGELGRLLGVINGREENRSTLVILTSDHGESFMEHGWLGHTRSLHEELVRVPLIVQLPDSGDSARVVSTPVSLAQIPATIREVTGIDSLRKAGPSASLVPLIDGRDEANGSGHRVLIEVDFASEGAINSTKETHQKALIDGRFKLVRHDATGVHTLHDLDADPEERRDIAAEHPERVARLRLELESRLERARALRLARTRR